MAYVFILVVGLLAGVVGGVVGTGSSIMLLPVLIYSFGPKQAVPIMAIAAVMANLSRMIAWWRDIDWQRAIAFTVTAVPGAILGARSLLALPSHTVDVAIGVFLLSMVPVRRCLATHDMTLPLWSLLLVGAITGYLTGIVASTGPITVPIFMTFGLVKGALLGTEAAASLAVYIAKSITFQRFDALPLDVFIKGLIAGSSLFVGAFVTKRFVLKLDSDSYRHLIDGMMLVAGVSVLWSAFFA